MQLHQRALLSVTVLCATAAHAAPPSRPDLVTTKPLATCQLQTLAAKKKEPDDFANAMLYTGRPVEDPLSNYERTSLGDWPMLATAERTDPWLRLVLLSRKRPVVIDLAVLVGGKSFRDKRDSWIDDLVTTPKPSVQPTTKKDAKAEKEAEKGNNKPESPGTKPPVKPSESTTTKTEAPKANAAKNDKKEDKAYSGPTTTPMSRQAPSMRDRLADYLTTNKAKPDREEVRWLIASWGAGPGVVLLDPSLSWQRSELSPLETYLDQNGDGIFSREEIAQADEMLKRADVDSNDVVDLNEIRRAVKHPAFASAIGGYPLIVVLDASTDMLKLESILATIYKSKPTIADLQSRPADITLQVNLGASDKSAAGVSVLSLSPDLAKASNAASATTNVATVDLGGDYIEFSAAQGATAASETDSAATQIAIGAALDGNPLLRLLDHDNDGRLTRRERQEISGLFASLDRDGDGSVSSNEVPVPIRFAVTLGPHVHELLATPVPAARSMTTHTAAPTAPAWFKSMDKNNDGDLSRSEFLGTTEQFKQLDTNGDGLLSVPEALKLKTGK